MELKQLKKNRLMNDMIASGYYARFLEADIGETRSNTKVIIITVMTDVIIKSNMFLLLTILFYFQFNIFLQIFFNFLLKS